MTAQVYQLADATICVGERLLLRDLSWQIPDQAVTVVFGAVGVGKSTLLRLLSRLKRPPITCHGTWSFRGDTLFPNTTACGLPLPNVAWCGQPPREWSPAQNSMGPSLQRALARQGCAAFLLDEPNRWILQTDYPDLARQIRQLARNSAVVVATHHIEFARSCADHIVLLGGGRMLSAGPSEDFFGQHTGVVAQFLRSGSVWPAQDIPEDPRSLRWVIPGLLGGMAYPGLTRDTEDDFLALQHHAVAHLVSLTERAFIGLRSADYGVTMWHFPIRDMGVPSVGRSVSLVRRLTTVIAKGEAVILHCKGGLGRTGLMLALMLVARGRRAHQAVDQVREAEPRFIQTQGQLAFVRAFADAYG